MVTEYEEEKEKPKIYIVKVRWTDDDGWPKCDPSVKGTFLSKKKAEALRDRLNAEDKARRKGPYDAHHSAYIEEQEVDCEEDE
jgi:hypothetical protein